MIWHFLPLLIFKSSIVPSVGFTRGGRKTAVYSFIYLPFSCIPSPFDETSLVLFPCSARRNSSSCDHLLTSCGRDCLLFIPLHNSTIQTIDEPWTLIAPKWLNVTTNFYTINLNHIRTTKQTEKNAFGFQFSFQVLTKHRAHHTPRWWHRLKIVNRLQLDYMVKGAHEMWKIVYDSRLQAIAWTNR